MKLLVDENLSPSHARTLEEIGFDAVAVLEIGLSGADDDTIRAYADRECRIVITLDADFANLLRYPVARGAGTIRLRIHPATEANIDGLLRAMMPQLRDADLQGKLAIVERDKIRVRG